MTYRVGEYLRLSRDDERDGESLSIENQRAILTNYVREQGWELVDTYIDDGFTGTNFERPSFQRMIADVKSRRINLVIVKDLSRFGRNYVQAGEYTDYLFPSLGCRFIALNDGVDTLNAENDIMPFKNLFNEFYSRDISKKVKSAKTARVKSGFYLGSYAPFGYRKLKNSGIPFEIDETAAAVVRRIFNLRCGGMSYRSIASTLNGEQVVTPRDYYYLQLGKENPRKTTHKWTDVIVKALLSNEAYIGNLVQFKTGAISYKNHKQVKKPEESWIRCEGTHQPIVTIEQWNTVRELALKSSRYRATKTGETSLFSGLLRCADCGSGMKLSRDSNVRKDGHRNNHHAYICCTYSNGGAHACTPHRTLLKILSDLVKEDIRCQAQRILYDEETVVRELLRRKRAVADSEQSLAENQLHEARARLAELDRLIAKLYEETVLGQMPREVLLDLMEKYQGEKQEKAFLAKTLTEKLEQTREAERDVREWVALIKRHMDVEEIDRDLLIRLIDKIVVGQKTTVDGVDRQEITIHYNLVGALSD